MGKMMNVTSIEELKRYGAGEVIEFPPFAEGQPFVARVKRPSMLHLVKNGKIPNSLLTKANDLFMTGGQKLAINDTGLLSELFDIIDIIAEDAFIEPKYSDIKDAGVELADDQLMFLFNYTQKGVRELESFRTEQENRNSYSDSETV